MAARCRRESIGLLCYGGLAGGFLSDHYLRSNDPAPPLENRSLIKYRLVIDEFGGWSRFQDLLSALAKVAARHDVHLGTVAIRWLLDQAGVSGVIVGARHAGHLDDIRKASELRLDDDDREAIARVQAGASGPAGDVYALERVKGGPHASIMRYDLRGR
jgi:aryl-alcohol dehydrogenase-like predicted oxidoreductase